MQVLDLSIVCETVIQILLARLLVDVGDDDDPAFDGAHGGRVGVGGHAAVLGLVLAVFGGEGRIDIHFCISHDCAWLVEEKEWEVDVVGWEFVEGIEAVDCKMWNFLEVS